MQINIKRKTAIITALAALLLSGCSSSDKTSADADVTVQQTTAVTTAMPLQESEAQVTQPSEESVPEEEEPEGALNNLTGLYDLSDEAVGKRPVAIMINNITFALPQYGIAAADMIFECPVEGTITRLMAVYGDMTKIPDVCSIRSCRYYYPIFALGLDAVYVHWGKDETIAKQTLEELSVDRLDGYANSYIFDRDKERAKTYSSEHTGYYKGSLTVSALERSSIRSELLEEKDKPVFSFSVQPQAISDTVCEECTIPFSATYFSDFTYDEEEGVYYKTHNGAPHIDSAAGRQLSFTNVFALGTTTEIINQDNLLISLDWHGGDGYYISQGTIMPIKWSKADEHADIVITDTDGNEITVNPGKSYLGFTPRLSSVTYK